MHIIKILKKFFKFKNNIFLLEKKNNNDQKYMNVGLH